MSIFKMIKPLIARKFIYEGKLTMESRFIEDLGADSLDFVELINDIEDELGIEIILENLQGVRTVGDLVNYLQLTHGQEIIQ